jgi:hypothetical protein
LGRRWAPGGQITYLPHQHSMVTVEEQRKGTTPLTHAILDAQTAQGPGIHKSRIPNTEKLHCVRFQTRIKRWQLTNYRMGLGSVSFLEGKNIHSGPASVPPPLVSKDRWLASLFSL